MAFFSVHESPVKPTFNFDVTDNLYFDFAVLHRHAVLASVYLSGFWKTPESAAEIISIRDDPNPLATKSPFSSQSATFPSISWTKGIREGATSSDGSIATFSGKIVPDVATLSEVSSEIPFTARSPFSSQIETFPSASCTTGTSWGVTDSEGTISEIPVTMLLAAADLSANSRDTPLPFKSPSSSHRATFPTES
ncbi:Uncharacterised protein [Klebsiella pneumoniae]|nr:Uncharacterised protein [Klebsiella pneumoniae]